MADAPVDVQAADLDGDDVLDLITANGGLNGGTDDVSVILGNPDGSFQPEFRVPVGENPTSVLVADLNEDGVPDLVTTNAGSGDITVLIGRGDATFVLGGRLPLDNFPFSADVTILTALGDATFKDVTATGSTVSVSAAETVDFNGDGVPDVVTLRQSGDILFREGRIDKPGQFAPPALVTPFHSARAVTSHKSTGNVGLAAIDSRDNMLMVYRFDVESGFSREVVTPLPGRLPAGLAVGDFDGDERRIYHTQCRGLRRLDLDLL